MKKFILTIALMIAASQAFAVASFLAGINNAYITVGGLLTTTTTSVHVTPFAGLVVFADNGEAFINVGSEEAKEALKVAVQKTIDGEELSYEDSALIEIYAQHTNLSADEVIQAVAAEL
jgi:hypothetical protein